MGGPDRVGRVQLPPAARDRHRRAGDAGGRADRDRPAGRGGLRRLQGRTTAEIVADRPGWDLFADGTPGGEAIADAGARADAFIQLAVERCSGRPVVAFSHGHFSRILTARLLAMDPANGARLYNDTASVGVVMLRRGVYVLDGWNMRTT